MSRVASRIIHITPCHVRHHAHREIVREDVDFVEANYQRQLRAVKHAACIDEVSGGEIRRGACACAPAQVEHVGDEGGGVGAPGSVDDVEQHRGER